MSEKHTDVRDSQVGKKQTRAGTTPVSAIAPSEETTPDYIAKLRSVSEAAVEKAFAQFLAAGKLPADFSGTLAATTGDNSYVIVASFHQGRVSGATPIGTAYLPNLLAILVRLIPLPADAPAPEVKAQAVV